MQKSRKRRAFIRETDRMGTVMAAWIPQVNLMILWKKGSKKKVGTTLRSILDSVNGRSVTTEVHGKKYRIAYNQDGTIAVYQGKDKVPSRVVTPHDLVDAAIGQLKLI